MDTYSGPERRTPQVNLDELVERTVVRMVQEIQATCLNPEEQRWVRMAIEREARRAALARAVIEKSLAGLLWAAAAAAGVALWKAFVQAVGRGS